MIYINSFWLRIQEVVLRFCVTIPIAKQCSEHAILNLAYVQVYYYYVNVINEKKSIEPQNNSHANAHKV